MATTEVYIQSKRIYDAHRRPNDLKFSTCMRKLFGQLILINKSEIDACSKVEQARHFQEDAILGFLYIKYKPLG